MSEINEAIISDNESNINSVNNIDSNGGGNDKMEDLNISGDQNINIDDSTSNTTTTTTTTTTPTKKMVNKKSTSSTPEKDNKDKETPEKNNKRKTKAEVIVEIEDLLKEKSSIENKLASLEKQIYALEGRYLEDTHHIGNVIRGFDSYISGSGALKKLRWKESDRLFSTSSSTYTNSINESTPEMVIKRDKKKDKGKGSGVSSKKNG